MHFFIVLRLWGRFNLEHILFEGVTKCYTLLISLLCRFFSMWILVCVLHSLTCFKMAFNRVLRRVSGVGILVAPKRCGFLKIFFIFS